MAKAKPTAQQMNLVAGEIVFFSGSEAASGVLRAACSKHSIKHRWRELTVKRTLELELLKKFSNFIIRKGSGDTWVVVSEQVDEFGNNYESTRQFLGVVDDAGEWKVKVRSGKDSPFRTDSEMTQRVQARRGNVVGDCVSRGLGDIARQYFYAVQLTRRGGSYFIPAGSIDAFNAWFDDLPSERCRVARVRCTRDDETAKAIMQSTVDELSKKYTAEKILLENIDARTDRTEAQKVNDRRAAEKRLQNIVERIQRIQAEFAGQVDIMAKIKEEAETERAYALLDLVADED